MPKSKACQICRSGRIVHVSGKCADQCFIQIGNTRDSSYVPFNLGIGGGDYIAFDYCLECGQIQDKFPIPSAVAEELLTQEIK